MNTNIKFCHFPVHALCILRHRQSQTKQHNSTTATATCLAIRLTILPATEIRAEEHLTVLVIREDVKHGQLIKTESQ